MTRRAAVTREPATVFKVDGGRRYFTKKAAFNAAARIAINKRCECERGDGNRYSGFTCSYHENPERYMKIVRRLARLIECREVAP